MSDPALQSPAASPQEPSLAIPPLVAPTVVPSDALPPVSANDAGVAVAVEPTVTLDTSVAATIPTNATAPLVLAADGTVETPALATEPVPSPAPTETPVPPVADPAIQSTGTMGSLLSNPQSILDVLISLGKITPVQSDELLLEQMNTGKSYEALLEEKNMVSEEELTKAKATLNNIPFIKISETGISPEALTILPESVARRYNMLPFAINKQEQLLSVAMLDPLDLTAVDFAQQKTGFRIKVHYAMPSELERTIVERYAQSLSSEVTQALAETSQVKEQKKQENLANLSGEVVRQAPIVKIIETVLMFAMKARASDIHIEPQLNRTRVRYRIDGILTEKLILPKSVHDAVVSRIKILAELKIDEKRVPQDGRFNFVADEQEVDLRISTLPTIHGEKVVMRLLEKNASVPTLDELGLRGMALDHLKTAIKVPHGIVLVTGPTGSGKTTTLYSVLHIINTPKVNIITLEDPVEYQIAGVNQVQINPQAGLTFSSGLRSFLRQDPNIIMVGEIRDTETVELAVQASLTGHLVFSTLHTSSAAGALPRLLDMGAEPFLLASSMTLTMAQRICRRINPEYVEEYAPEPAIVEDIKQVLGVHFDSWCKQNNKDPNKVTLYRAKAERPQTEPEYKGRIGIYEVMPISEQLRSLILEKKPASELEALAMKRGMLLMKQDGYLKALDGITTIEEVLRVAEV